MCEIIHKSIKVRIYPTYKQKQMLDRHFNAFRFCYNLCLQYKSIMWNSYKISKSGYDMQSELYEIIKNTPWLSGCKVECIRESATRVELSFKEFFRGKSYPKYKKKLGCQSFPAKQSVYASEFKLTFFGSKIKYKTSDKNITLLETNKIKSINFKKDKVGDYWASCLIEIPCPEKLPISEKSIGIDLGIKNLVTTSDGIFYKNSKFLQSSIFKIKKLDRKFSRSQKGSNNRNKIRIKIAKLYRKASSQRTHYYNQITNDLIRENQTIVLETLKIQNMIKNHTLASLIKDSSWGLLISMLEYKASIYGRNIIKIGQWIPSTKTCSSCGNVKYMDLDDRIYNCLCGLSLDRDVNAAINIRNSGIKMPDVSVDGVGYEPNEAESKSLILTV